jgi:hypothetical protein
MSDQNIVGPQRFAKLAAVLSVALVVTGCTNTIIPYTGTAPPDTGSGALTGNWQVAAATTSGTSPFSALAGSVTQEAASSNGNAPVYAIFQTEQADSCYVGEQVIPLQGSLGGTGLPLTSLSVDGQYLTTNLTTSNNGSQFQGSFQISGGCADGVKGTLTGTKITALTGSYAGPTSSGANTVTLASTQDSSSDGYGAFHLQGSATFTGVSCFSSAMLQYGTSTVSGQQVILNFVANDSDGSVINATGTLAVSGSPLTLSSLNILSGSCQGDLGSATLTQ